MKNSPQTDSKIFENADSKKRKGNISEEDMASVLQRYSAKTILALLQEITHLKFSDGKIDWNELAKKASIGITCPRECQMLWRHLAYRHPLLEKLEEDANPLDDDSDLEFEVEPSPSINGEASMEAFAYVKVLMSSGLNNDSSPTNNPPVEAPLTINIPEMQVSSQKEDMHVTTHGQNIRVPVLVQKHALPSSLPVENLDGNGTSCSNQTARKKRKGWNKGDEKKLMAAIEKRGVGNWQDLEKEDFRVPRTASEIHQPVWDASKEGKNREISETKSIQSSKLLVHDPSEVSKTRCEYRQKWIHMKTKNTATTANNKKTTITEDRILMQQAVSMALDMHSNRSSSVLCSGGVFSASIPETASFNLQKVPNQSQQTLSQAIPQKISSPLLNKSWTGQGRTPITINTRTGSNTMIQKAAIAAGGRIAPAETAASLFKAAQSKNVVHIRPGGTVSVSAASTKPSPSPSVGSHPSVNAQMLSSPPPPSSGMVSSVSGAGSQMVKCSTSKPTIQPVTQPFSTVLQQPSKQPLEKTKSVFISSSALGNLNGSACSLPQGSTAASKPVCSSLTTNQGQKSVVELETDEMDSCTDATVKGNGTMKDDQESSKIPGSALENSSAISGCDNAFHTKICEMKQISPQSQSQETLLVEDKNLKPVPAPAVDGCCSRVRDGIDKTIVPLELKPNEGCSEASSKGLIDSQDKSANPRSNLSTPTEGETKIPLADDRNTENQGHQMGTDSVTAASTANDS